MNEKSRNIALGRDNYECQLSRIFGVAHLAGVPCVKEKEAHHKTYERFGNEDPDDLIVVCRRCHDFLTSYIRSLRYFIRNGELKPEDVMTVVPVVTQEKIRNEDIELQDHGRQPINNAQRIIGGPFVQGDHIDLEDFKETSKDRSRLGRDGET